jgi:hypothetical protein
LKVPPVSRLLRMTLQIAKAAISWDFKKFAKLYLPNLSKKGKNHLNSYFSF